MRRQRLLDILTRQVEPIPGAQLAEMFGVSRQVIVQDIALLRAQGHAIDATTRGYRIAHRTEGVRDVYAVRHRPERTEAELNALVDLGITVLDVIVYHPVYGELRGGLGLRSRRDVQQFLARLAQGGELLSTLTGGAHVHTVEAQDEETLDAGRAALEQLGVLDEPRDGQN